MLPTQPTPKSVSPQKDYRRRARAVELETTEREVQEAGTQTVQVVQVEVRKKEIVQGFDSYDGI
jgi:ribosomal protein S12 methylthiotransferase accessory factor YcaO